MVYNNMLTHKIFPSVLNFSVIAIILSPIIYVMESPIKFVLYLFGISLVAVIFILISKDSNYKTYRAMFAPRLIDYFFVLASTAILIFNISSGNETILTILSIIVSLFLPGWALIRMLGLVDNLGISRLTDYIPLIFSISVGFSALIFYIIIVLKLNSHALAISLAYIVISLLPIIRNYSKRLKRDKELRKRTAVTYYVPNILSLSWIFAFFVFFVAIAYPQMAYVPDLDIVTHYSSAFGLIIAPELYASLYPWYHFVLATIIVLSSSPPMWLFQLGISVLSFVMILSFYAMAKAYLAGIDKRAPAVATITFSIFGGFGWIYFLSKILSSNTLNYINELNLSYFITYYDIGTSQGPWLWLWFRPITLGFTVLFVLIYLMRREDLDRRRYLVISSLLLIILGQVHFTELVFFIGLIFFLVLLVPSIKIRLRDTTTAVLISVVAYMLLAVSYEYAFRSDYLQYLGQFSSLSLQLGLILLGSFSFILARYHRRPWHHRIHQVRTIWIYAGIGLVFILFVTLLWNWYLESDEFDFSQVSSAFSVPWRFYPMLLGLAGAFAIVGAVIMLRNYRRHPIVIFAILLVLSIIVGKFLTYLNIDFFFTGYWERRIIPYAYVSVSILSSIAILYLVDKLRAREMRITFVKNNHLISIACLAIIILAAVFSTYLTVEYEENYAVNNDVPINRTEPIQEVLNKDPFSTLLTVSESSRNLAEFSSIGYIIGYWSNQIWPSGSPELPLNIMGLYNNSYILMSPLDFEIANDRYNDGYVYSHLLKHARVVHEQPTEKIYEVGRLAPPSPQSDVVLVTPEYYSDSIYYAYDLLSSSLYDYTTAPISDINSINNSRIVIAPTEEIALQLMDYKTDYGLKFGKMLILNTGGYGQLTSMNNMTSENSIISNISSDVLNIVNETTPSPTHIAPKSISFADFLEPFIVYGNTTDGYEMYYLNIYPVIKTMRTTTGASIHVYPHLSTLLSESGIDLPTFKSEFRSRASLVAGNVAAFDEATYDGDLRLNSTSVILSTYNPAPTLDVDEEKSVIKGIYKIAALDAENIEVNTNKGTIKGGQGFYSQLLTNSSNISFEGNPARLQLTLVNGDKKVITGREIMVNLTNSSMSIMMRQPDVLLADGEIDFRSFFSYGSLYNKLRALDNNLKVYGKVSFHILYADQYVVSRGMFFQDETVTSDRSIDYNGISDLVKIFHWPELAYFLLVTGVVIFFFLFFISRRRLYKRKDDTLWETK